jgi:site-specific recombinase XerD
LRLTEATNVFCEEYLWASGFSGKTEMNYRWAINSLVKEVGDIPIETLGLEHIKLWRKSAEAHHWERNSVNAYMYKYRSIARWWCKRGMITFDPDEILIPKKRRNLPKFLTRQEILKLISIAEPRERAIIALLYSSGMRVGEIVQVRKKDVQESTIKIRGKGDTERMVFIDAFCKQMLSEYLITRTDGNPFLFYSMKKNGVSIGCIQLKLRKLGVAARVEQPVTPHLLRHSAATHWMQGGMGLRYIQELLGHADISTTQIYTHVVKEDLTRVYAQFHKPLAI